MQPRCSIQAHPEIVSFGILSKEEMIERLSVGMPRDGVEAYYVANICSKYADIPLPDTKSDNVNTTADSLLNPRPDRAKVERIVAALDVDSDGHLEASEMKVLFSRLTRVPVEEIPDDHPDVLAFSGLKSWAIVAKLCRIARRADIDRYYDAMFPGYYR